MSLAANLAQRFAAQNSLPANYAHSSSESSTSHVGTGFVLWCTQPFVTIGVCSIFDLGGRVSQLLWCLSHQSCSTQIIVILAPIQMDFDQKCHLAMMTTKQVRPTSNVTATGVNSYSPIRCSLPCSSLSQECFIISHSNGCSDTLGPRWWLWSLCSFSSVRGPWTEKCQRPIDREHSVRGP